MHVIIAFEIGWRRPCVGVSYEEKYRPSNLSLWLNNLSWFSQSYCYSETLPSYSFGFIVALMTDALFRVRAISPSRKLGVGITKWRWFSLAYRSHNTAAVRFLLKTNKKAYIKQFFQRILTLRSLYWKHCDWTEKLLISYKHTAEKGYFCSLLFCRSFSCIEILASAAVLLAPSSFQLDHV